MATLEKGLQASAMHRDENIEVFGLILLTKITLHFVKSVKIEHC